MMEKRNYTGLNATLVRNLKKKIEELEESEEKYRALFETAKDAIFLTDETGKFIDVNRAACESLGYSKEELLKLSNKEIDADPEGYKAFQEVWSKLVKERIFEVNQQKKDGTLLPVEITGNSFTIKGRQVFLVIARDITERKKAEEQRILFSQLIGTSPDGIAMGDPEGIITYVNDSFVRMFGYSREDLIGKPIPFIYSKEQLPKLKKALKATMKGSWTGELIAKRKNGELFPVAISASRVVGNDGRVVAHMASHRDITARKQMEEKLRQKVRELEKLKNMLKKKTMQKLNLLM